MSIKVKWLVALLLPALVVAAGYWWWVHDRPRRQSLASLTQLNAAIHSANGGDLLRLLIVPAAVQNRNAPEQVEFLVKALNNEISPEGLATLRRDGDHGPLKELFPTEAETWARLAGVSADDCFAFKLERNGVRAEVVLVKPSKYESDVSDGNAPYRIVRVNNVKQMAELKSSTAERNP